MSFHIVCQSQKIHKTAQIPTFHFVSIFQNNDDINHFFSFCSFFSQELFSLCDSSFHQNILQSILKTQYVQATAIADAINGCSLEYS